MENDGKKYDCSKVVFISLDYVWFNSAYLSLRNQNYGVENEHELTKKLAYS